jgi:hypothetical protein
VKCHLGEVPQRKRRRSGLDCACTGNQVVGGRRDAIGQTLGRTIEDARGYWIVIEKPGFQFRVRELPRRFGGRSGGGESPCRVTGFKIVVAQTVQAAKGLTFQV